MVTPPPTRTRVSRKPFPEAAPDAQPTPAAFPIPNESFNTLDERQNIVTISITTGDASASASAPASASKGGFPVAVAVPALVGGMAAAILAFGLWWWLSKRRANKRRERWEAAQRRKRRAANNNGRPSTSSSRNPSATNLKAMAEKEPVPPVPMLPKHAAHNEYAEKQYGGNNGYNQGLAYNAYPQQPHIDQYEEPQKSPTYSNGPSHNGDGSSASSSSSDAASTATLVNEKSNAPAKPSRSAARIAAAESAVARENLDATVRYAPKKPSPLALKAQENASREASNWGGGPFQQPYQTQYGGDQEMLAPPIDPSAGSGVAGSSGKRVVSGEWGVALGSPNHDPAMSFAEQQAQYTADTGGNNTSRYSNDPYLSAAAAQRAPSGQYTVDPYAGYHDPIANASAGGAGKKKSNWV